MDSQGPTVEHTELHSIPYGKPYWKTAFFFKMYICVTESLCCIPETNRTWFINYTSILKRKKKFFIWKITAFQYGIGF